MPLYIQCIVKISLGEGEQDIFLARVGRDNNEVDVLISEELASDLINIFAVPCCID